MSQNSPIIHELFKLSVIRDHEFTRTCRRPAALKVCQWVQDTFKVMFSGSSNISQHWILVSIFVYASNSFDEPSRNAFSV
jgi:hypothetical protein